MFEKLFLTRLMNFWWSKKHIFRRPAKPDPAPYPLDILVKPLAQFRNGCGDSPNGKNPVAASVAILSCVGLQFAITWLVITVAVYPPKRPPFRYFTDIRQESCESCPLKTYLNSFSAVELPFFVVGIPAPIVHHCPNSICSGSLASLGVTVLNDIRHSIGSFNVVFSGGCPARTGTRCDYAYTT